MKATPRHRRATPAWAASLCLLTFPLPMCAEQQEPATAEFVSMATDAGATVERGVFTAGGLFQNGNFSIGAIDYYSADIINIAYLEAKLEVPVCNDWKLKLAAQYADQSAVGANLLNGSGFAARQFGLKAELPVGHALFAAAFTSASGDANMQNPWSGYPGFTSAQVQDFNRYGEDAFLLRADYDFTCVEGLVAYALGVFGTQPDEVGQYRQDECDLNLQWAPPSGVLKCLALRLRYGIVEQHGGDSKHSPTSGSSATTPSISSKTAIRS